SRNRRPLRCADAVCPFHLLRRFAGVGLSQLAGRGARLGGMDAAPSAASINTRPPKHGCAYFRPSTNIFATSAISNEPALSGLQSGLAMPSTVIAIAILPVFE